jgi:hypothetical protein
MDNHYDNLTRLFDQMKSIGFWGRLFRWKKIKNLVIDAASDMQRLQMNNESLLREQTELKNSNSDFVRELRSVNEDLIRKDSELSRLTLKDVESVKEASDLNSRISVADAANDSKQERIHELAGELRSVLEAKIQVEKEHKVLSENAAVYTQTITDLTKRKSELDLELSGIKKDLENCEKELFEAGKEIAQYESLEETRVSDHKSQTSTLKEIQENIQKLRQQEVDDKHQVEIERIEGLKLTWSNHEDEVKQVMKTICSRHTIQYIDKVPFKGEPDNTISIAGEFIIFDAKSPRGEDLTNFPNYIKEQSEKAKKYAKEENVKKWIFFVVPGNTLSSLKTFVYPLADFDVFIIGMDALEPVILSLKKIEEYDFAEQMNPEDRENICRVLGRFAHLSKRRIQIDTYFINQFMELAYKTESDLPPDILEKVIEFEKAEKLNPPVEKRAKSISLSELEKSTQKLRVDTISKGIVVEDAKISNGLNDLPLYRAESDDVSS